MARSDNNLNAVLQDTADAIKAKINSNAKICPRDFKDKIASIPTGITPTGTFYITENDFYDVSSYQYVDVNVSGGGNLEEISSFAFDLCSFTITGLSFEEDNIVMQISFNERAFTVAYDENEDRYVIETGTEGLTFDLDQSVSVYLPILSDGATGANLTFVDKEDHSYGSGSFDPKTILNTEGVTLTGSFDFYTADNVYLGSINFSDMETTETDS